MSDGPVPDGSQPDVSQPDVSQPDVSQPDVSRDREAARRDAAAYRRDRAADQRDDTAADRDDVAAERDAAAERDEPPVGSAVTEATRARSTTGRQRAATDRDRSRGDREAGASGRMDSERDRVSARLDRGAAPAGDADVDLDVLTGAYRREPGLAALDHDVTRAGRRGGGFVVALVRLEGSAATGGDQGRTAADRRLVALASALRTASTGDQVLVRHGHDEFLYGLPGLSLPDARRRVADAVAGTADGVRATTGLAELREGESTGDLVARARAAAGATTGR